MFDILSHVRESTKVLDSGIQHLDFGFQPFGFRIPTFWIPDSILKWIPDSKPLWIQDSDSKNLPDSGFSYMGRDIPAWGDDNIAQRQFSLS